VHHNAAPGIAGGWDGSATSHHVATINMFYQTTTTLGDVQIFASVSVRPIVSKLRSMHIINTVRADRRKRGFRFVHDHAVHAFIHVDSITAKVMFVPHFKTGETHMCAVRMWEAR
jgi:hypothetical protein